MAEIEQLWRFGGFELDSRSRELLKSDRKLKLQEQPFQILTALIERHGEVVTRDELRKRVWAGNTFVDFDNGLNVAIAKLRHALDDHAENPAYIETLPRLGYRFVANVEVLPAAQQQKPPAPEPPAVSATRRKLYWVLIAGAALACLALVFLFVRRSPGPASAVQRPSVAIIGFRNLTARADQNWLSTALAEMLATELSAGDHVRIIAGESVARTKLELALPDAESYSASTLSKIWRSLGADYVLVGSYLNSGAQNRSLRLDLRLQNSRTGEMLPLLPENGSEDALGDLVAQAGAALRERLAVGTVSQDQANVARAVVPPSTDSARLYAEGLNSLRRFDARGARDLLGQAVALDPGYALAHAALSDAWSALGYAEVAKKEAEKAFQLSTPLPPLDRLSIEARFRETNSEWDQATRIYHRLIDQFPDNADYGLRLAGVQINAGKANEALATLDRLQKLPFPLADEATISFVRSQALEKLGDYEHAQAAASHSAEIARGREAQLLEADALAMECRQLVQLSRLDPAVSACGSARTIYTRTGNRLGMAASMAYLAAAYCNLGNINEARNLYNQALDIDREIGNARGDAQWALNGLAVLLMRQGDLAGTRKLYEESLEMARGAGSRPDEVSELSNIASTWLLEGNLHRARELFEQALKSARSIGAKGIEDSALNDLGRTLYLMGDLPESAKMLDQAVAGDRETGAKLETADALSALGRVRMAQGRFDEARQSLEASVQGASQISGQIFAAQYRLYLGELALAMAQPAEAEASIRASLAVFLSAKGSDRELEARILLVRALLDQAKFEEARQEAGRAEVLARVSQRHAVGLAFSIAAARTQASSRQRPDVEQATRRLQAALADAQRQGYAGYQFDARLALAEVQASRAQLEKLQKDAHAAGFETIARSAARALEKLKA